jgi:hypothetical protein
MDDCRGWSRKLGTTEFVAGVVSVHSGFGRWNASYCFFGHDWTNYYAAFDLLDEHCRNGFTVYSKSAAKQCNGFDPHNERTWCDIRR